MNLTPFFPSFLTVKAHFPAYPRRTKKKGQGNRKCGNRYLSWAWIEAANFSLRFSPTIRSWYDRKCSKRHKVIAIKAVAHKLARAGYYLMCDGGTFDEKRAFG